jgi:hypothetical protein
MASRTDKNGLLYESARSTAKRRGIAWEFTQESWFSVWHRSGKLSQRGNGADDYVMARFGDVGPYAPSNFEIITRRQNSIDGNRNKPKTSAEASACSLGRGRGWTKKGNRFQVVVSHRYVGLFRSQGDAETTYLSTCDLRARELA